jgi:hypothetical protein
LNAKRTRANIRVMARRILRKHGYPPDLAEEATQTVLAQAEVLCADWAYGFGCEPFVGLS